MALKPIKVSQLNNYIKRILATDPLLGNVLVKGEISNLKYHNSGHVYFSLKDDKSKINCFLAVQILEKIRYELEEGMEITVAGFISVYEPGGYYSLSVRDIEVSGKGDLAIAFEKLKNKLSEEGIFDNKRKKEIPSYPEKIAVITAQTGAAIKDILKIITNKNNMTDVLVYPVLVQGPKAAQDIADAIDYINKNIEDIDTIIVGRGGGSLEDLWAFNEEIVARAIYRSSIPIISAVGHEMDITISDLVADKRAETPTAAAAMVVPDTGKLRKTIDDIYNEFNDRIDEIYKEKTNAKENLNLDIFGQIIQNRIEFSQMECKLLMQTCKTKGEEIITKSEKKLELAAILLDGFNPKKIMERGYAAIIDENGILIKSIIQIKNKDKLTIIGADGLAKVKVEEVIYK